MWARFWPPFLCDLINVPSDLVPTILAYAKITPQECRGIVFEFAQYLRSGVDQRLCTHQAGGGCKCGYDLLLVRQDNPSPYLDLTPDQSSCHSYYHSECHCPCQNPQLSPEIRKVQAVRQENREKRLEILHHYTGHEFMDHVYHQVAQLLYRAANRRRPLPWPTVYTGPEFMQQVIPIMQSFPRASPEEKTNTHMFIEEFLGFSFLKYFVHDQKRGTSTPIYPPYIVRAMERHNLQEDVINVVVRNPQFICERRMKCPTHFLCRQCQIVYCTHRVANGVCPNGHF